MNEQSVTNISNYAHTLFNKREYWRNIIKQWQKNPIPSRDFCKRKDLNRDQFDYWRRKFTKTTPNMVKEADKRAAPSFIEVVTHPQPVYPNVLNQGSETKLHITLPNNMQLIINVPIAQIKELVAQLGGIKC